MHTKELIVIKIGSNVLTDGKNRLNHRVFRQVAEQVKKFHRYEKEIIIVSSGAIACGMEKLHIDYAQRTIPQKQAAASVGQTLLMNYYSKFLRSLPVGQILLTADAINNKQRAENFKNTIRELLHVGVVPIINENDSVVVDEIKFGDNDMLSAQVAALLQARKLIIMTDIDGLYDANPKTNRAARLIPEVKRVTADILKLAGGAGSHKGTGGMASKVAAAKLATAAGVDTYILNGYRKNNLLNLYRQEAVGTHFLPQ